MGGKESHGSVAMSSGEVILDREGLVSAVERMVQSLSAPLTLQQKQEGWTEPARIGMVGFWGNLLERLKSDRITEVDLTTPPLRGLDIWGVQKGELLQTSAQIFQAMLYLAGEGKISVDR